MTQGNHTATNQTAGRTYTGPSLLQIAMPMGGIGAGCVCLNGYGGLQDFSIRNKPATTALPDGHGFTDAAFALLHVRGAAPVTRLVEGPLPPEKVYDQGLQGQGYRKGGHEGLPRFATAEFHSQYPFGTVRLSDPALPLAVSLEGWSPFIPRDAHHSGLPCAILTYTFENVSPEPVSFAFSYHLAHPAQGSGGEAGTRNAVHPDRGLVFANTDAPDQATFGSAALFANTAPSASKAMWFRGGWFDSLSALWREVSTDTFSANDGTASERGLSGRNGGSLSFDRTLAPAAQTQISIVLAWHFPNCATSAGKLPDGVQGAGTWQPYYAAHWQDAGDVAEYVLANFDSLYRRTTAFRDALFDSTLPPALLDAVASNLAILKSPTVLRQANGNVWGWEGCFATTGCCHGSCTHVWNYAQALPHLFPELERTLREQEYLRSLDARGHVSFRAALPDALPLHDFHAAADGQLGGILKLYRDWQISGDSAWLARLYPLARRSLEFCIAAWDPDQRGALFEPHHNTYDIEFWGPDGMCATIYLGALCAFAALARALSREEDAARYTELATRSAAYLDTELFNGEYYIQRVQWEGLRDVSFVEARARIPDDGSADEMALLLKREGPKYQYGSGCLADGVLGAWMARLYGVETPLSQQNVRSHLRAVFTHGFKPDLSEHACLQRPGYAVGHEPGLLLCTWPQGGKPTLPFVYSDEVWTGIEYQVASHLILEGMLEEGLTLVAATRSRYDGRVRNPFNEYECGNYYARAMASYALLEAVSGFHYEATTQTLRLAPKIAAHPFQTFFSADSGFGTLRLEPDALTLTMTEGELAVAILVLTLNGAETVLPWAATARVGEPVRLPISPALRSSASL